MEEVYTYYRDKIENYERRLSGLNKKIHLYGTIRLLLMAGLFIIIWLLKGYGWQILTGGILTMVIPFALLMYYHNKLAYRKSYTEAIIRLCRDELKGLDYDFSSFDGAPEMMNGEHSFSLDLDLFGERSFFQSVNRSATWIGKQKLAGWFLSPLKEKKEILRRQEAVEELSSLTHVRQNFHVLGKLNPGEKNDINILPVLANEVSYFSNSLLWKIMVWLVPGLWAFFFALTWFQIIPYGFLTVWLIVSMLIAYLKDKEVQKIHNDFNKMEKVLLTYSQLIRSIEGDAFKSEYLTWISNEFQYRHGSASAAIRKVSRLIGSLDQRLSAAGVILNIFILRDTRKAMKLEKWKDGYAQELPRWFEALAQFDALSSLAGFAFNHPSYTYPGIAGTYFKLEGKQMGHPLIPRDVCVCNDISIEKNPWFMIVTGANMAGKSTYLRTVGINYLLACIGAPVFAEQLVIYPASLVTSLRTSDSLVSNESYFFAELKRLKMIIDRLRNGEELFIILDEILKGTNSVDKQKGSLALIKQLIRYDSCGIIATHDLILGSLKDEFPEEVKNYRFEADITNDELTFSYLLREGIAENMNACFLMNKMGITV